MDVDDRLDALLAESLDTLLSLASQALAAGRPELALAAHAAVEPLAPWLDGPILANPHEPAFDLPEDRPHAEH